MFGIIEQDGVVYNWRGDEESGGLQLALFPNRRLVQVSFRRRDLLDRLPCVDISWSAVGAVSIEETREFKQLIDEGIRVAGLIALRYVAP